MNDLVKGIRDLGRNGCCGYCEQAADEIERLRAVGGAARECCCAPIDYENLDEGGNVINPALSRPDRQRPKPCPQEAHDHCVWPRCDCAMTRPHQQCEHGALKGSCTVCHMWSQVSSQQGNTP